MIKLLCLFLSMLVISSSNGQAPAFYDTAAEKRPKAVRNMTAEEFRFVTVDYIVTSGYPLKIGSVQLHRMGDEVAVHLLKRIAKNGNLDAEQTKTALDMLEKAFERPGSIINRVNRQPLATVSLLKAFSQEVQDSDTQNRIGDLLTRFKAQLNQ